VGDAKATVLEPWPAMGCEDARDDGSLRASADGALGDCVVSIAVDGTPPGPPTPELVLRAEPCGYEPHVAIARPPVQIVVENGAAMDLQVHAYREPGRATTVFNATVPPGGRLADLGAAWIEEPGVLRVTEDRRGQYLAWVHVVRTPHVAVTDHRPRAGLAPGEYLLDGVPAGEHEVVCWHEAIGREETRREGRLFHNMVHPPVRVVKRVKVVAGETATVDFDVPPR
jgi:hypothetical protein